MYYNAAVAMAPLSPMDLFLLCIEFLLNAHLNIFITVGYQGDDVLFHRITEIIVVITFYHYSKAYSKMCQYLVISLTTMTMLVSSMVIHNTPSSTML